jgi:3-isopropylmalate/(R)-2-methylmalate dehydratase small subunit
VTGRGLALAGDEIDTDRIMPARFLRVVSFDGLEAHVFEDDRVADPSHAFNNPKYRGASILIVNRNFGCGSSREHAPQGLARWGFHAVIGESFSEIFRGNSSMLGVPCFTTDRESVMKLQTLVASAPETEVRADVKSGEIVAGSLRITGSLPSALRDAFLSGQWDPTAMLLDRFDEVRAVAARLPYVKGF